MKRSLLIGFSTVIFLLLSVPANAFNELVLKVYKNGEPASGLTASLDGKPGQQLDRAGMTIFDLPAGGHSIQLLDNGKSLHSFRFDSAQGQLVDVTVSLPLNNKPRVAIESYFTTESAAQRAEAPTGFVTGKVTANGLPVADATVSLAGTRYQTTTDEKGNYSLEAPRGVYKLEVSHPDLGGATADNYRIVSNATLGSNFTISALDQAMEEVVVMAKFNASAFQESERFAVNVVDTLGVEQLARFGDTDVASAVIRAPGVTVQDGKFVFIRGLGGRYITTTLNGSSLPSTNPVKRTVPLDLFPSDFVEQLDIKKTFVASMPGESTGGNLEINTRTFPDQRAGQLSISMGYLTGMTGDEAYVDPNNGDWDWIGINDGSHDEADGNVAAIGNLFRSGIPLPPSVKQQLGYIGALETKDNLDLKQDTALPNLDLGITFGDLYSFTNTDAELGYFAAANYKNQWTQRENGSARSYEDGGNRLSDNFSFEQDNNIVELNGLLSIGLNIGDNTFKSNSIISRNTESTVRVDNGEDGDAQLPSKRWTMDYVERQFLSQQFTGQHLLGESDRITLDWQGTFSQAIRNAPNRREVRFDLPNPNAEYELQVGDLTRRDDDLTDDNQDFSSDLQYILGNTSTLEHSIQFGFSLIHRKRDSDSNTYGFDANAGTVSRSSPDIKVSQVINTSTITGDRNTGYTFVDKTLVSDSYEGEMDLRSVYTSYDMLWNSQFQVVAGVRYEDFRQDIDTFETVTGNKDNTDALDEGKALPSLGLNWFYTEDQQLRLAISQTVSRPDFKERSNAIFFDPEFDFRVRGNPDLDTSDIINYDIRWETYFSDTETISIALFYKDMTDPIERVVLPASGTVGNSRTFQNADSADIYGIEIDGRKNIPLNQALTKSLFVAMNASWIESNVKLLDGKTRDLQGQPEYTANLILGYDDIINGQELTVLFNQNGKTIADVGLSGLPDVIQEPTLSLNVNYKYYLNDELTLTAKIKNLLNSEVKYTQAGNTFLSYETGTEFKAGIDWRF